MSYLKEFHIPDRSRSIAPFTFNLAASELEDEWRGARAFSPGLAKLYIMTKGVAVESEHRRLAVYQSIAEAMHMAAEEGALEETERIRHSPVFNALGSSFLHAKPFKGQSDTVLWLVEEDSIAQAFDHMDAESDAHAVPHRKALNEARRVWADIWAQYGSDLIRPGLSPASDGSLMMYWRGDAYHLELEFFEDHWEAFYIDKSVRGPESLHDFDLNPGDAIPEDVHRILDTLLR